jgi:hypothetical protein
MSGVGIVRYLLANNAPLVAVVPAAQIYSGLAPLNTPMPAISVSQISGNQLNNVAMTSPTYYVVDRVQVTVHTKREESAKGYAQKRAILALVRTALIHQRGTINGFACEAILPDTEGPDLEYPEEQMLVQSQDYMVGFNRPV